VASEEAAATSELHSSFCVWQVSVYNNRGRLGKLRGGLENTATCCLPPREVSSACGAPLSSIKLFRSSCVAILQLMQKSFVSVCAVTPASVCVSVFVSVCACAECVNKLPLAAILQPWQIGFYAIGNRFDATKYAKAKVTCLPRFSARSTQFWFKCLP